MSLLSPRFSRIILVAALAVLGALAASAPANASHLKGGYISTAVDEAGQMTIHVKSLARRRACTTDGQSYGMRFAITAPDGVTQVAAAGRIPATRCLGQTIVYEGDTV